MVLETDKIFEKTAIIEMIGKKTDLKEEVRKIMKNNKWLFNLQAIGWDLGISFNFNNFLLCGVRNEWHLRYDS